MSCSAFANDVVDKDEETEFQKRVAAFRVALRRFVRASKLTEERFDSLVYTCDRAWGSMVPKPKAQCVGDVLREAFCLKTQGDAYSNYIIMIDDGDDVTAALGADAAADCAQQYTLLLQALGLGFRV